MEWRWKYAAVHPTADRPFAAAAAAAAAASAPAPAAAAAADNAARWARASPAGWVAVRRGRITRERAGGPRQVVGVETMGRGTPKRV